RTDESFEELAELRARSDVTVYELGGLHEEHVGALITEMLALEEAPPVLGNFLARQSRGNPFFVAEFLRAAVGEGVLRRPSSRGVAFGVEGAPLTAPGLESVPLPRTVRDLVARRLERFSAAARQLAEVASVVGTEFHAEVLLGASGLGEAELMDLLA